MSKSQKKLFISLLAYLLLISFTAAFSSYNVHCQTQPESSTKNQKKTIKPPASQEDPEIQHRNYELKRQKNPQTGQTTSPAPVKKQKSLKQDIAIFPDEYSELDDVPVPNSTEDETVLKYLEKSRQKYLQALTFVQNKDTVAAARSFNAAIDILNELASYPGIEDNEDFTDLAQSIIEDYESYIKDLEDLDENSPLFIIRDRFFQEIETITPRKPKFQSLSFGKDSLAIPGLDSTGRFVMTPTGIRQVTIPLVENEFVQNSLVFLTEKKGYKYFKNWLERSGRWFPLMKRIAAEEGMPEEIIYLSMIESGLQPQVVSRAKAVGLWQFIRSTGELYGLNETSSVWLDERRDPEKSTRAAMRHLKDLYNEFGDWHLALAAYNCGAAGVRRAMNKFDTSTTLSYWNVRTKLPRETRNYVPLYIAAAKIALNPEAYGFKLDELNYLSEYQYDVFTISEPVSLSVLAKCIDSSVSADKLRELNPELLRSFTPPDIKDYSLKIPKGSLKSFSENFAALSPEDKEPWLEHKVERGETITKIAKKYEVSKNDIVMANDLQGYKVRLKAGTILRIPIDKEQLNGTESGEQQPAVASKSTSKISPAPQNSITHTVEKGETLTGIAAKYGVRQTDLRNWNNISYDEDNILVGTKLLIAQEQTSATEEQTKIKQLSSAKIIKHKVRKGETLARIADDYNVSIESIKKLNKLKRTSIHAGQVLKIQTTSDFAESNSTSETKSAGKLKIHKVRKGETISSIAEKYGVSESQIKLWNPKAVSGNTIFSGVRIKLYSDEPAKGSSTASRKTGKAPSYYTVRKGDTLSDISKKFGVSIAVLKKNNKNLDINSIRIGQKIRIQ